MGDRKQLPNEHELERRFQQGDEAAFAELYSLYYKSVEKYVYNLRSIISKRDRRDLAQDITQDAFMRAWNSCATFNQNIGTFEAFVKNTAKYVCKDTLDLHKKSAEVMLEHFFPGSVSSTPTVVCSGCGDPYTDKVNNWKFVCNKCGLSQFVEHDNKRTSLQPPEKRCAMDTSLDFYQAKDVLYDVDLGFAFTEGEPDYELSRTEKINYIEGYRDLYEWMGVYTPLGYSLSLLDGDESGSLKLSKRERKIAAEVMKLTPREKIAKMVGGNSATLDTAISRIKKKFLDARVKSIKQKV